MNKEIILKELQFKAVRSSGPGGQHANKVSSKVELNFDFFNSNGLTDIQKKRISLKLGSKLTKDGLLLLQCDDARSQHKNKSLVIDRFFDLLDKALLVQKKRKPTKPSKSSIEKDFGQRKFPLLKK